MRFFKIHVVDYLRNQCELVEENQIFGIDTESFVLHGKRYVCLLVCE